MTIRLCRMDGIDKGYASFVLSHFEIFALADNADLSLSVRLGEVLSLSKQGKEVEITLEKKSQLFFALNLLSAVSDRATYEYQKATSFEEITFMADASRAAVPTVESCKKLIVMLAKLGYTALELYTEDTYTVPGEPYFGHLRGRYTQEELKELDAYAKDFGIELVPCIQTLAHLGNLFVWPCYEELHDTYDCLLIDDEKTYALLEKMFCSLRASFSSGTVHIGYDESHYAGRGKFLDQHGYEDKGNLLRRHLSRVLEIAARYGFHCKIYADMFFKNNKFVGERDLPEGVDYIYWDYFSRHRKHYDIRLDAYLASLPSVEFTAGAWKWLGPAPQNRYGMSHIRPGVESAKRHGLTKVSLAAWGDDGAACPLFAALPQVVGFATACYFEKADTAFIANIFSAAVGAAWEDFLLLDLPNGYRNKGTHRTNPAKYLTLNDPLYGMLDAHVGEDAKGYYKTAERRLRRASRRVGDEWKYLFDESASLCRFLSLKANMGNDLSKLYHAGDKEGLARYRRENIEQAIRELDALLQTVRAVWYKENKPFGFEVIEGRLGALRARLGEASARVGAYLDGTIDALPELDAEKLPIYDDEKGKLVCKYYARWITTPYVPLP